MKTVKEGIRKEMKTIKEFLKEKVNSKAEKVLDTIMKGEDGEKLADAMGSDNRKAAEKILKSNKIKGSMFDSVMFIMFDDM